MGQTKEQKLKAQLEETQTALSSATKRATEAEARLNRQETVAQNIIAKSMLEEAERGLPETTKILNRVSRMNGVLDSLSGRMEATLEAIDGPSPLVTYNPKDINGAFLAQLNQELDKYELLLSRMELNATRLEAIGG